MLIILSLPEHGISQECLFCVCVSTVHPSGCCLIVVVLVSFDAVHEFVRFPPFGVCTSHLYIFTSQQGIFDNIARMIYRPSLVHDSKWCLTMVLRRAINKNQPKTKKNKKKDAYTRCWDEPKKIASWPGFFLLYKGCT